MSRGNKGKRGQHPNSQANLAPHKFQPGESGNPGGRPKGFANQIKSRCGEEYERLVEGLYLIAFGTPKDRKTFFGASFRVTTKDRLRAIVELRDSGPGRPVQVVDIDGRAAVPAFALPPDTPGVSVR